MYATVGNQEKFQTQMGSYRAANPGCASSCGGANGLVEMHGYNSTFDNTLNTSDYRYVGGKRNGDQVTFRALGSMDEGYTNAGGQHGKNPTFGNTGTTSGYSTFPKFLPTGQRESYLAQNGTYISATPGVGGACCSGPKGLHGYNGTFENTDSTSDYAFLGSQNKPWTFPDAGRGAPGRATPASVPGEGYLTQKGAYISATPFSTPTRANPHGQNALFYNTDTTLELRSCANLPKGSASQLRENCCGQGRSIREGYEPPRKKKNEVGMTTENEGKVVTSTLDPPGVRENYCGSNPATNRTFSVKYETPACPMVSETPTPAQLLASVAPNGYLAPDNGSHANPQLIVQPNVWQDAGQWVQCDRCNLFQGCNCADPNVNSGYKTSRGCQYSLTPGPPLGAPASYSDASVARFTVNWETPAPRPNPFLKIDPTQVVNESNLNSGDFFSFNQQLVGKCNPKMLEIPIVVAPSHDLDVWKANDFVVRSGINDFSRTDNEASGYTVQYENQSPGYSEKPILGAPTGSPDGLSEGFPMAGKYVKEGFLALQGTVNGSSERSRGVGCSGRSAQPNRTPGVGDYSENYNGYLTQQQQTAQGWNPIIAPTPVMADFTGNLTPLTTTIGSQSLGAAWNGISPPGNQEGLGGNQEGFSQYGGALYGRALYTGGNQIAEYAEGFARGTNPNSFPGRPATSSRENYSGGNSSQENYNGYLTPQQQTAQGWNPIVAPTPVMADFTGNLTPLTRTPIGASVNGTVNGMNGVVENFEAVSQVPQKYLYSDDLLTTYGYDPENSQYGLPVNMDFGACRQNRQLREYNENLMTQTIQPGVYSRNQVMEQVNSNAGISFTQQFEPTLESPIPGQTGVGGPDADLLFTQYNPRIPGMENLLASTSCANTFGPDVPEDSIYDPRLTGYGTTYRAFINPVTEAASYVYDDVDAIRNPNYVTRNKIDIFPFGDRYSSFTEQNQYGNLDTCDIHRIADQAFLDNTNQQRLELQNSLMRKNNAVAWQRRMAPLRVGGSGISAFNKVG